MAYELPLGRATYDVGPGGGLVTAMGGINALTDAMLKTRQQQLENYYLPYEKQAEVAQKMAQAQYLAPQILTQFLSNPNIWSTLDPSVQAALTKQLGGYFTNPQSGLPNMPPMPPQGGLLNRLFGGGQAPMGGGMPPGGGIPVPGGASQSTYQGIPQEPPIQTQDMGAQGVGGQEMANLPPLAGMRPAAAGNAVSEQAIMDKANGMPASANQLGGVPRGAIYTPAARQAQAITANIPGGANPLTASQGQAENLKQNLLEQTKAENQNWDAVHAEAAKQAEQVPLLNQLNEDMIQKYRNSRLRNALGDIPVKGIKSAPLRAVMDTTNEQGVDQDRAQMIQLLGKNVQPAGHITDNNYNLLSQSKFDRSFTPTQAESAYEKNKALLTRSAEKQPFLYALQNNNPDASWREGQILFNLYASQKPAFANNKFQQQNTGRQAWNDYTTPQALAYVRSNLDYLPQNVMSSVGTPAPTASQTQPTAPQAQPAAPQAPQSYVRMRTPDGRLLDIPANNVDAAVRRGLKRRLNMDNYEDLGAVPVQDDYSDLGARPVLGTPAISQDPNAGYGDPNMPWGERIDRNALAGVAQFGHALLNAPHNLVNLVSPQTAAYIPTQQDYNFAQMVGAPNNTADQLMRGVAANSPSILMPEAELGQAGNAIRAIPKIGNFTANAIGRILPQAAFGAVVNQDPLQGAEEYGGMQTALEAASPVAGALAWPVKKAISALQPQKYAQNILNYLGNGMSIPENARTFAAKIKGAYENAQQGASELYGTTTGNPDIANSVLYNDQISPDTAKYLYLKPQVTANYTPNLEDLHDALNDNPMLSNAHELQSDLGKEARRLEGMRAANTLDTAGQRDLQNFTNARSSLLSDIHNHLDDISPGLSDDYKAATENYAKTVGPYHFGDLSDISLGKTTDPENISNSFKTENNDLLNSVVKDIGPSANSHIIYDQLGDIRKMTPEKLLQKFNDVRNSSLGKYITPEMYDMFDRLGSMVSMRNAAQKVGSAIGGYSIGSSLGIPYAGDLGAGLLAGYAGHGIANALSYLLPGGGTVAPVANALSKAYQPTARAIIENSLINQQGRKNDNQLQYTP